MTEISANVKTFFNALSRDYTATIERCFPRYREMLWATLFYLPADHDVRKVLELGCGTGNLSVLIRERFPDAELHVVDLSVDSLEICRSRLEGHGEVRCIAEDFRDLEFETQQFDLVLSSIAIHHLDATAKKDLFRKVKSWLREEGVFCFCDQCAGVTVELSDRHTSEWQRISFEAGSSPEEWEMWMSHQSSDDHHDTLVDQMDWLREAGFHQVDCLWRFLLWSVIQAS